MGQEIERKFLVNGEYKSKAVKKMRIIQAYLSSQPERTVRVRVRDGSAYLTIKGIANESGVSRFEWEKEISREEAMQLLEICESGKIDKTRFIVPVSSGLFFEVDEFCGENDGLIIAEIELPTEDHPFDKPEWLGLEVTGDKRYYNSVLKKKPFKTW